MAWLLVAAGVGLMVWSPWRTHDVFGDGSVQMAEWRLTEAVTLGGPRRADAGSDLDRAINEFLTSDHSSTGAKPPAEQTSPPPPTPAAAKSNEKTKDDFCPT